MVQVEMRKNAMALDYISKQLGGGQWRSVHRNAFLRPPPSRSTRQCLPKPRSVRTRRHCGAAPGLPPKHRTVQPSDHPAD